MSIEYFGPISDPYAILIRKKAKAKNISFLTENHLEFQIGLMTRSKHHLVPAHIHTSQERVLQNTSEFLFVRKGLCKLRIFDSQNALLFDIKLRKGDSVLLVRGGHEIQMLKKTEILEVKQGPYNSSADKVELGE